MLLSAGYFSRVMVRPYCSPHVSFGAPGVDRKSGPTWRVMSSWIWVMFAMQYDSTGSLNIDKYSTGTPCAASPCVKDTTYRAKSGKYVRVSGALRGAHP